MIRDLSETLRAVLDDPGLATDFPQLEAAAISFERPTDTFSPASTSLDLFLFDVRENLELRSNEPHIERIGTEAVIVPPPRRIDCSYLITAWPVGGPELPLQEHRLLAQAYRALASHPTLPPQFLQGSLVDQQPPLPLVVPQVDGLKSPAEFWTAMGARLRAAITVTVTISVPVLPPVVGPLVTTRFTDLGADGPSGAVDEQWVQIGGQIVDPGGAAIAHAVVDILDAGLRAITGADGRYNFPRVPRGNRTVRAVATGFQPQTRSFDVPGPQESYEFTLAPSP